MITFLINRAKRRWQVLSTVLLGVLISTAFLASGPIVVDAVINFALPHKLRSSLDENGFIYLTTFNDQGEIAQSEINAEINELLRLHLKEIQEIIFSNSSNWLYPWQRGTLINDERINLKASSGVDERINFVSGKWPEDPTLKGSTIPAVVPQAMASAYGIRLGDRLPVSLKFDELEPSYWIEIAGIFEPKDASDPYWLIDNNPFQSGNDTRYLAEYGVLLQEAGYYPAVDQLLPKSNQRLSWLGIISPSEIKTENIDQIIAGVDSVRTQIARFDRKVSLQTNLDRFLEDYVVRTSEIVSPLFLLVGEVLFLGLYYVLMVAGLSIRQIEGEMAVLASRGADLSQLLRIQLFDAFLISMIAFVSGPFLAQGIIQGLAIIGPLADINQTDWLTRIPRASWLAAAISVLACFTALIIPVIPMLRRSIIQHHQSVTRRIEIPWWHRYYVDVLVLVIGLAAIWRLSLYGSITNVNQGNIDWLLLFSPLILLIGSATVLLRIFPLIFKSTAIVIARSRGLTASLAFWQTARDPTHVTRLILLFTLVMALGVLSTGLNATLDYSESERARYSTGGEARISFDNFISPSSLDSLPQVVTTSAIWRGDGRANMRSSRNIPDFSIIAIDPFSFATVSQFRTDYTDEYIGFVLGQLVVDPAQLPVAVIPLPGEPTNLGIWVADPNPERSEADLLEYVDIRTKIQTAEGEIAMVDLDHAPLRDDYARNNSPPAEVGEASTWLSFLPQVFTSGGNNDESSVGVQTQEPYWRYYESPLPRFSHQAYPLSLHSIWIKIRRIPQDSGQYTTSQGPLIIDDLSVGNSDGEGQVFESFEEITTIWQTDSSQSIASYTKRDIAHSGNASVRLYLGSPETSSWMVLSPAQTVRLKSIPVLASPKFLESTGLIIGDQFAAYINGTSLTLEVKNSVNYFPTMYETGNEGYIIISRDALLVELNRSSRNPININEIWFRVDETQEIPSLLSLFPQAKKSWEVGAEKLLFKSDPLTLGLRSVIFLGYALTQFLSLVGFGTYFYMSARKRGSVYGILRALGLSTDQLYVSLVLEQLIIILAGLGLGIFLGSLLNWIILPGLPISYADLPAIPPFVPRADWYSVSRSILILLAGFLFTLAAGTFLLWRNKMHQTLRVGEE